MNRIGRFVALIMLLSSGIFASTQNANAPESKLASSKSPDQPMNQTAHGGSAASDEFVIGNGDVLNISVWKNTDISRVVPVRTDGRITLPLVGELQASGRTAKQLERDVSAKLKDYVAQPEVSVIVQEIKSQKINVLGMVNHPGSFPLAKPMTVVDAIAAAGGFRDFAKEKDVYVLRRDASGKQIRFPFNYRNVMKGKNPDQNIELDLNDTVVVP